MISGKTTLIAHIGYPTETFKAPLIYNPWFDAHGIDAVVAHMRAHGAELIGEMHYEGTYHLAYIRGPEGIIVALAEQLG